MAERKHVVDVGGTRAPTTSRRASDGGGEARRARCTSARSRARIPNAARLRARVRAPVASSSPPPRRLPSGRRGVVVRVHHVGRTSSHGARAACRLRGDTRRKRPLQHTPPRTAAGRSRFPTRRAGKGRAPWEEFFGSRGIMAGSVAGRRLAPHLLIWERMENAPLASVPYGLRGGQRKTRKIEGRIPVTAAWRARCAQF